MIGGWILGHTVFVARHGPGWVPLIAFFGHRVCQTTVLAASALCPNLGDAQPYGCGMSVAYIRRYPVWQPFIWAVRHAPSCCGVFGFGLLGLGIQTRIAAARLFSTIPGPSPRIGDSLTSGVPPYGGYPDDLAERLVVPVVNLGQAGITAKESAGFVAQATPCEAAGRGCRVGWS